MAAVAGRVRGYLPDHVRRGWGDTIEAATHQPLGHAALGLFASAVSGASMNPARSLAPALVGGSTHGFWIYLVGPLAGAAIALALAIAFYGRPAGHVQAAAAALSRG